MKYIIIQITKKIEYLGAFMEKLKIEDIKNRLKKKS